MTKSLNDNGFKALVILQRLYYTILVNHSSVFLLLIVCFFIQETGPYSIFTTLIVYWMDREQLLGIGIDELLEIARFSNAMAAIVATTYGGSTAMPGIEEVRDFLYNRSKEV